MFTRKIIKSTGTLLLLFLLVACRNENMPEILAQPQEWLLFEQNSENGKGIFRFDLEQASDELTPLLNDYQHIDWIYLSPDGQHAAIRVQDKINVRDLISGKQLTQLSAGIPPSRDFWFVKTDNLVAWSPTGDKLAFIQFSEGPRTDILLFDVINNQLIFLTNDVALENALAWSPNGDKLAFATTQSCDKGIMDCSPELQYWNVAIIDPDGSNNHLVTNMSDRRIPDGDWVVNSICRLQWSPDQRFIAFRSFCPSAGISTLSEVLVTATGSPQLWQLTEFGDMDYDNSYSSVWSSDSRFFTIGYTHDFIFDDKEDEGGFLTFETSHFTETQIFTGIKQFYANRTSWSPNAKYVLGEAGNGAFLGSIQNGEVTILADNLPSISLKGIWVNDKYITQFQNRLISVLIPSGEILDLGIELGDGMELVGHWRVNVSH